MKPTTGDADTGHSQTGQTAASVIAPVLERNIDALLVRRRAQEAEKTLQDHMVDTITRFTGSMLFVYIHLTLFAAWIIVNLGFTPLPRFDPSLAIIAMFASVEAIFLSTFVLISQNRMAALNDKRADLDLQVSLLAKYEITRVLQLVVNIADHVGVQQPKTPELAELVEDVDPETVLDRLDEQEKRKEKAD